MAPLSGAERARRFREKNKNRIREEDALRHMRLNMKIKDPAKNDGMNIFININVSCCWRLQPEIYIHAVPSESWKDITQKSKETESCRQELGKKVWVENCFPAKQRAEAAKANSRTVLVERVSESTRYNLSHCW